jgi:hypothetical protein
VQFPDVSKQCTAFIFMHRLNLANNILGSKIDHRSQELEFTKESSYKEGEYWFEPVLHLYSTPPSPSYANDFKGREVFRYVGKHQPIDTPSHAKTAEPLSKHRYANLKFRQCMYVESERDLTILSTDTTAIDYKALLTPTLPQHTLGTRLN